jgi:hypothetical protein
MLPTPNDNDALIKSILDEFDRKGGAKKDPEPTPTEKKPSAWDKEIERRLGRPLYEDPHGRMGPWEVQKGDAEQVPFESPLVQTAAPDRTIGAQRLQARLDLLRTTPGWMARVKDAIKRYKGKERMRQVYAIVEDSNRHFGHWAKEQPKPLVFG